MDPWGPLAHLPRQKLQDIQNEKLRFFLTRYLYPFSPYYRKLFDDNKIKPEDIRSVADLHRVPLTSKTDFMSPQDPDRFRSFILQPSEEKIRAAWSPGKLASLALTKVLHGKGRVEDTLAREFKPAFMTFTTGTTSQPVPFLYSNHDMDNLSVSGGRMLKLFDIKPTENIVNMFPYAPHLAFWQVVYGALSQNNLAISTGGGKVMGTDGNIAVIRKIKPAVVLGVPSYVYHLMQEAAAKGHDFHFINKIVLGAARVTTAFKLKLIEIMASLGAKNVAVFGTYGFTEARCAWAECPTAPDKSSGYHLYPDKEIFEVIDPKTGEVKGEGEDGELVYTALDARASVVLRYRTGDFAKGGITYQPCPGCGRTLPRISSDITRLSDIKDLQLSKIKGSLVNLGHFDAIFSEIQAVDQWQVELKKKNDDPFQVDELIVYACVSPGMNQQEAEDQLRRKLLLATELTPNAVHWISRQEIVKRLELETANKEKRILDKRPKE